MNIIYMEKVELSLYECLVNPKFASTQSDNVWLFFHFASFWNACASTDTRLVWSAVTLAHTKMWRQSDETKQWLGIERTA